MGLRIVAAFQAAISVLAVPRALPWAVAIPGFQPDEATRTNSFA